MMKLATKYFVVVCGLVLNHSNIRAADVWIFSGQSNMQSIGGAAKAAVGDVVTKHGRNYKAIYVAAPGKPIEAWLDSRHRDFKLWRNLAEQIAIAKKSGDHFQGFVWYQGESNVSRNPQQYQQRLTQLIARVRQTTGAPNLPIIVVQIGAATSYDGQDWHVGVLRESQRRFAWEDKNAAVVAAIDAKLRDYTVHLSRDGARIVAQRIAKAADRLGYGNTEAYWGPQFERAFFADKKRRHVVVEFSHVAQRLALSHGWMAGFGVSVKTALPKKLSSLKDVQQLGRLRDDFHYPIGGTQLDGRRLVLAFSKAVPENARLSYAPMRNAQYGPHRRWVLEFGGLCDASKHQAPAFVLVPIEKASTSITVPQIKPAASVTHDWRQIAVNCVGRFPDAVTTPKAVAGVGEDNWRQAYWNPVAAGLTSNLYDRRERVTSIGFSSGVWYMSPYYRKLRNADDALMASWCKHQLHQFRGLNRHTKYDLGIYLLQGSPKKVKVHPSHRSVRISILHMAGVKRRRDAKVVVQQSVNVPALATFDKYVIARESNKMRGNVLVLRSVPADSDGHISLAVEVQVRRGKNLRWTDATLAGVQIRKQVTR